ncbi:MAG: ATP-binding protein [Kiritimatiellaeota bacterium]|nr:ATP-binding protein [Kiritimatiellota bacterium]
MNNNSSKYLPRWMAAPLQALARAARVTVLTGARQVGKSTLLSHELGKDWRLFSMDDFDIQSQAQRDPDLLLASSQHIILDEAHLIPALFPRVKRLVDQDRSRRFILSGSANLLLLSRTTESLAGRAEFLRLLPFSAGELAGQASPAFLQRLFAGALESPAGRPVTLDATALATRVWNGGMPEIVHRRNTADLLRWREGYIRSYLEKDLRDLSQIANLPDFKRLMSLAALRCGCLLNQSDVARDAGLSQPTAHRYLGLLEVSEQCVRLTPFHAHAAKSLVKAPKLMWTDTGIAAFAAGFMSPSDLLHSREWGAFLECYVYNQLRAVCGTWDSPGEIFFWRTRSGVEVDFVIRHGRRLLAVEVKAGQQVRYADTAGLQEFMRRHSDCRAGIVLYAGGEQQQLADTLWAVPLSWLV